MGSVEQQTLFSGEASDGVRLSSGSITDVFSSFAKHLTPSYRHDRIERSVQMRLYTLYKGQFVLIFIMFLCLFLIALLMGMAGPTMMTEHTERASGMEHNGSKADLVHGPFLILTPPLDAYRRELWLQAVLELSTSSESFHKEIEVTVNITSARSKDIVDHREVNRQRRTLRCDSKMCTSLILVHLARLESKYYLLNVSLDELESVELHYGVHDWHFNLLTYNPEFTAMETGFRCFFVVATVVAIVLFVVAMNNFAVEDWAMEQKWVAILLLTLLGFNNPCFPLTLTSGSLWPGVMEALFQTGFLCLLLLFWLCVLHGLRQNERSFLRFYAPKLTLVFSMFSAALAMALAQEMNEDPGYSYEISSSHFAKFQLYFISLLSIYVVWLIYLALLAFGELRFLNYLDARLKFHLASMLVVLVLTLSLVWSRFGKAVLADNFVARVYTSYESQTHFLAFYTVLNCYVFLMVYVYSPANATPGMVKDNPSVSMLNESDDEDIEMRNHECTPLTSTTDALADFDDSD